MLTTELDRAYIQELITLRDLKNNGMSRGEVIAVIQRLTGSSFMQAENHWYYCRQAELFPKLKGHGALRSAQSTTTKRSGVTTEKLLCWHATVDEALNELDSRNSWHDDWEGIKNSDKIDSFWGNMDETCMSAADGKWPLLLCAFAFLSYFSILTVSLISCAPFLPGFTKVVASKAVKKHQMNKDDNRGTITIARCGLASGADGPRFFLVKGEKVEMRTFQGNFAKKHKAPPGSKVIATPNAYMTNKVWNEMAPAFAKGLRAMPVVREYPDLWMTITLDGYGSHLEGDALKVFADHKILIVKEEGDTSQVCQAYDNKVALSDKRNHCSLLSGIRMNVSMIDQWTLIVVSNTVSSLCACSMLYAYLMHLTSALFAKLPRPLIN